MATDGEVSVWTAPRAGAHELGWLLSDDERSRADGFRSPKSRDLYVTAYAMLRSLLGSMTGSAPQSLSIERAPCPRCGRLHGKPFLADDPAVKFNLSHSGSLAVAALAWRREVGVDIEDRSKSRDTTRLAARTLSPAERQAFDASGEDASYFLRLWTRKEALLKATGAGMTRRLSEVDGRPAETLVEFDGTWTLVDLDLPSSYVGTLAVEGTEVEVRTREWEASL